MLYRRCKRKSEDFVMILIVGNHKLPGVIAGYFFANRHLTVKAVGYTYGQRKGQTDKV